MCLWLVKPQRAGASGYAFCFQRRRDSQTNGLCASALVGHQHSQMETTLIYANATTEVKQAAVKKISSKEHSVFKDDEKIKCRDNDDIIRQLYGLI